MSQEIGLLSVIDMGRLRESPALWLSILEWMLLVPRIIILAFLGMVVLITGILSFLVVLLTAKFPQDTFDLSTRVANWTWRAGFYSLEEFIYKNWANIDWGSSLELHDTGKHSGRRFPAGAWTIDFLARDTNTNDLVVVQLKRGESSDSTVGELLRYISWIKEKVAVESQNVRGIIIAKKADAAIEYAIRNLPFVEVRTYEVDFQLKLNPGRALITPELVEKEVTRA